jgi:hypothetical protein
MSICDGEISNHLKFSNSKVSEILGDDCSDSISLKCSSELSECALRINDLLCFLKPDQLQSHGLIIDGKGGDDAIYLNISSNIKLMGVTVLAKNGDNSIYPQLTEPLSSAIIKLGVGSNNIYVDSQKDSVSMIMGFRNVASNKIYLQDSKNATYADLAFVQEDSIKNLHTLNYNSSAVIKLLNGYSLEELEVLSRIKLAQSVGEEVPLNIIDSGKSYESLPLVETLLNNESFVFG